MTPSTTGSVLVARAPSRAAGLIARLRDGGLDVTGAPVIERAPAADPALLDEAVRRLAGGGYAWSVVTSVNAVYALRDAAGRTGVDLAGAATRWAAVGPATRTALEAVGLRVDLLPADDDATAAGIVAAFPAPGTAESGTAAPGPVASATAPRAGEGAARRVLLPLGDLARPTLSGGLAALGWEPDVVTAYRTVRRELPAEVAARARSGGFDLVVVTSGSVAREVARQAGTATPVVAIGRPSADAARDAGLTVAAVAATPTDEALAAAVLDALSAADLSPTALTSTALTSKEHP